jgi:transcriptional regulator with GAF, ATPase, and Fis domain
VSTDIRAGDRERSIVEAFVSLAHSLVDGFDVVDVLGNLAADCARLLDIASAGVLLADSRSVLHVVAASSEATRDLELYQVQRDQGPCLDCYHSGTSVSVPDLEERRAEWPDFVRVALDADFASVHAIPMRVQDTVLGAVGLFGAHTGDLEPADLDLAQALAHVGSIAILQAKAVADSTAVAEQLQTALSSRVVIEQAKGVIAQVGDLQMEQSFAALRRYARDHNARLADVAGAVVARELPARTVIDHARSKDRTTPAG